MRSAGQPFVLGHALRRARRRGFTLRQIEETVARPDSVQITYPNHRTGAARTKYFRRYGRRQLCIVVEVGVAPIVVTGILEADMKTGKDLVWAAESIGIEIEQNRQGVVAVYFKLTENEVAETVEIESTDVLVDLDTHGGVVGIELLNPARWNLRKVLKSVDSRFHVNPLKYMPKKRIESLEELIAV